MSEEVKEALYNLQKHISTTEVVHIEGILKSILLDKQNCGIGRTSGTLADAQKDCEERLEEHQKAVPPKPYNRIKHIISNPDIEVIKAMENFYLKFFENLGYPLVNDAIDDRGGVSETAKAHHLYIAWEE
jgi:hypothetical protein